MADDKLYKTPAAAQQKISAEYEYWSGKLTDTSLQMAYAVIAANWVVFGSANGILGNIWAKWSVLLVVMSLGANMLGAWILSEAMRTRCEYAESDKERWQREFDRYSSVAHPWPFTGWMDAFGIALRVIKSGMTLAAGALLIAGAILK